MTDGRHDIGILASSELFHPLPDEAMGEVWRAATRRRLARKAVLYHQGDPALNFYLVVVGRLRATQMTKEGTQVTLQYLGPGEMAGYAVLAEIQNYPGTVVAVEDTYLFVWPARAIRDLMARHSQIAMNAVAVLGQRYQGMQARVRELSTETVERRIASSLLRLMNRAGRRSAEGIEISFPLSRQDIAELAGTTLHTVSRTLSAWEKDDLMLSAHRQIIIRQPEALTAIAEGKP